MQPRFEQFIRERQYLTNVSPATLEWYKHSFKWLPSESPTEQELKDAVIRMREKGLKATGCNSAIRAINAYLHWNTAGTELKCSPACRHLRIPQLKEPQLILPTFTTTQVTRLVNWMPKSKGKSADLREDYTNRAPVGLWLIPSFLRFKMPNVRIPSHYLHGSSVGRWDLQKIFHRIGSSSIRL
jgi:site-specific recombinase XerC